MFRSSVSAQAVAVVQEKLETARQLTHEAIVALPPYSDSEVMVDGRRHQLIVWHEKAPSGEDRVVVQLIWPMWLASFRQVYGEGFAVDSGGQRRDLTKTEVDDFTS